MYILSQKSKTIKTTLSVNGSKIMPNLETKLNFLATIPSTESDMPSKVIIKTKIGVVKLSGVKEKNKANEENNLKSVIKFGKRNISLKLKEDLLHRELQ